MRKLINRLVSVSLLSLLLIAGIGQKAMAQDVTVSYQTFYDNLAPYGQWIYDPQYGNVWVPNEEGDFRPYGSRGHWVMTDYGNTWVSDDPWGWACYHYGRWTYNPYYGWVWIPGYEWAPAWVTWRYGGGYCGWAPLGPGVAVGVSFYCPDSWWIFVGPQYMYRPDCIHYWRGVSYNTTYIHQTTIINNYYVDNHTHVRYNYGPRRDAIERDTHQPVQVYRVSQTNRPGAPSASGNRISMYRPAVNRESAATARPANVIQAPRQIGRPQSAAAPANTHQTPFRQEVQRSGGATNIKPNYTPGRVQTNQPAPPARTNPAGERPQPSRAEPQPGRQQPVERPQPQHNEPQPGRNPVERPQPQHNEPQPGRQQPQERPQPQHFEPQRNPQIDRPQPPRNQPPRPQPAPQPAPRTQPMPQPQPRPQMQPQQPRPMPQPAPRPMPAPQGGREHEGGRR